MRAEDGMTHSDKMCVRGKKWDERARRTRKPAGKSLRIFHVKIARARALEPRFARGFYEIDKLGHTNECLRKNYMFLGIKCIFEVEINLEKMLNFVSGKYIWKYY